MTSHHLVLLLQEATPAPVPASVTDPGPATGLAVTTGVIALILVVIAWPLLTLSVVIAHEGGHALFGSAVGGRVTGMHVSKEKKYTTVANLNGPLGKVLVYFAGHAGPSLFGLVGAMMLAQGKATQVLWVSVVFLILALMQLTNWAGRGIVIGTGLVLGWVAAKTSVGIQEFVAYLWIWLLLIGGFRQVNDYQAWRRLTKASKKKDDSSDGWLLRQQTHVPVSVWVLVFRVVTLAALLLGGAIMLGIRQV